MATTKTSPTLSPSRPLPPAPPSAIPAGLPGSSPSNRLLSLDALRGFDMCWILGLDAIIRGIASHLNKMERIPETVKTHVLQPIVGQLSHVEWHGLACYDLIFPLFLFLSGVSMAISVSRRQQQFGTLSAAKHLIVRGLLIVIIGIIYSGGLRDVNWGKTDLESGINTIRFMGVLQRIGIASAVAGLLSLWMGWRGLTVTLIAILAGYWALMTQIPVSDFGKGNLEAEKNLANYLDKLFLPGWKYPKGATHDPEGLLSTLPAIGTALLGLLSGKWLFSTESPGKKVALLFVTGAALAGLAWVWHSNPAGWEWFPSFPINKKLWTSSFVLVAGGISMMMLALFYAVIDVAGFKLWATPFVWVGANCIALYIASGMGAFRAVASRLTGTVPSPWTWIPALVAFLLMLLTARFLYRRGIFIRI